MAIEPTTLSRRATDERGRLIPLTEAEIRRQNAEAIRALEAIDEVVDDERSGAIEALIEAIDAEPLSGRKRFRVDARPSKQIVP